jgi:hypothetical protein
MSPAGMAQMEAVAQVHDVRLGIMPPMHNELLLPLLPNAPTAPQHNAGHQHAYGVHQQMQMPPSDVTYTMMFPAGANDHGELVAGRGPTNGMLTDSGPRRVPVDHESFHALHNRRPERRTIFDHRYDDRYESPPNYRQGPHRHGESQMFSDLTAFRAAQAAEQAAQLLRQRCWGRALRLHIPNRMTVVT